MANRERSDLSYGWHRLWIARNDSSGVAVRGLFSPDLHALTLDAVRPRARTLQSMENIRVLLLRGESGAGKSVALAQEAERLRAAGKAVEWADLTDGVCDLPSLLSEKGGRQDLTIFVDGLDMGLIRERTLDVALRRAVPELSGGAGARLRFALRTGFAAEALAACLAAHFGEAFEHLTLAPLRPEDVRMAAKAENIDPDAFLRSLEGLRVTPLAARPPTLRMLLGLWARDGRLPMRRQDIYREGCEVLLREVNDARLGAAGGHHPDYAGHLEPPERFAIACRLAALLAFGDRDRLDLGSQTSITGLHVDAVTRGVELVSGGTVKVTRSAVREVVGTALFRPAGADGFAFSHPSFMRFLAAAFVADHKLSPPQGLPLLCAADGRIGANRIETASWLAVLDPAYLEHLATADPQVVLRAGVPPPTAGQRLRLASALLALSAEGGLDLDELSETGDLILVSAPGLDDLLAEILGDKAQPQARRNFAARVATDTGCVPVATCAAVAMDEGEPADLRRAALVALTHEAKAAEGAILTLSDPNAPNEDLRIIALSVAMSSILSPADVIRRLGPRDRGSSQTYLCLRLLERITVETLPEALEALVAVASEGITRPHANHLTVAQGLVIRAFAHLDDARVSDAFATFIATLPPREPWLRWSYPLDKRGLPLGATDERRRALVSAVVARAARDLVAARNLLEACFLLRNEDLPWIVDEARRALGGPHAPAWATLAIEVVRGFSGIPYNSLRALGASSDETERFADLSLRMPPDYERWIPPRSWDDGTRAFVHEDDENPGAREVDEEEEPLLRTMADWKLLTTQTEASGRLHASSVSPAVLLALAEHSDRRLVHDSRDLLRVVREALTRLQGRLNGRGPLVRALWNEGVHPRPKMEDFLSDFVADHLRLDLVDRGIVADREVQIRSRLWDTPGERTDIQVQAFTGPGTGAVRQEVASLTIEVKGCWHPELYTAMRTQLVERYLASTHETVGLYLVGWYVCPAWSKPKIADLVATPADSFEVLRTRLENQARNLSDEVRRIEVAVLDATLA